VPLSAALELVGLTCMRGHRALFRNVSAAVPVGQMLRVQGDNGAGKTSLLRMISGLLNPAEGEVLWHGHRIETLREQFNSNLVYLGHAPALKDDLSAIENLLASAGQAGLTCTDEQAADALVQAGLGEREWLPARVLSQSQRKRIGLARLVLSQACALWVLDEPFAALDAAACAWLQRVIAAQLDRGGVVVLTSHEGRAWDLTQPHVALTLAPPEASGASL
jgi:heme exporter protein A